ncbi:hypothetical protein ABEB36_000624 [Hypothenemus hampei]|uniref:Uncharacterized protein n=1 Tax=Hypothenemus hampei TaxID=57062 RepID=A0ABD1FBV6_HYPHA
MKAFHVWETLKIGLSSITPGKSEESLFKPDVLIQPNEEDCATRARVPDITLVFIEAKVSFTIQCGTPKNQSCHNKIGLLERNLLAGSNIGTPLKKLQLQIAFYGSSPGP